MSTTNDGHVMYCPNCKAFNVQNRGKPGPYTCSLCGTIWKVTYELVEEMKPVKYYKIDQVIIREGKKN